MKLLKSTLFLFFMVTNTMFSQFTNIGEMLIAEGTEVSYVNDFRNFSTANFVNNGKMYFYKNYSNEGSFTSNNSSVAFVGQEDQKIESTNLSDFYNVYFHNSSSEVPFEINGDFYIENEVEFSQGIVNNTTTSNSFIFGSNASYVSASDASFIEGAAQKEGDTEFSFPIGKSGFLRNLHISAPENITDLFSSEYFLENSDDLYPHDSKNGVIDFIDTNEYWTLEGPGETSDVVVTISWNENTTSQEILQSDKETMQVVRWDDEQGFWVGEGGIVDEDAKTITTVSSVKGSGVFAIASVKEDMVLPGGIVIYNYLSPDGDGVNDYIRIEGLEQLEKTSFSVFNRNGVKVFETDNYNDTEENVFKGISDARATLNKENQLPTGTYFYVLKYTFNNEEVKKAGYLYINGKK